MKIHELIKELQTLADEGHGDRTVQINVMSGRLRGRSNINIKGVGMGIDWDSELCLIHPTETLGLYERYMDVKRTIATMKKRKKK